MCQDASHIEIKECCHHRHQNEDLTCTTEKEYRLSDFFDKNWEFYLKGEHALVTKEQYKAVSAMRACRTAVLGIDHYVCKECGEIKEIYHNCRNRFCPTCSWGDTVKWASRLESQMMDLAHRHAVFTVPHALIPLVKRNGKELLNILLRTSADTLKDWASHKYGIKIGVISVLHTFGETKDYHLHVHMIVSWGGIESTTGKLIPIKGEYVNYKFIKDKFRIKFEDCLLEMYDKGTLEHTFIDRISFLKYIKQINKTNWVVHLEPPMPAPSVVIRYIGRYSKRACLSEHKITSIEGEYISFRHKDYKVIGVDNKPIERNLRLHYREFFPRLLQHVPFSYFRLVRYYGLYSTKSKIPDEYLNKSTDTEEEQGDWENPFVCSFCQQEREYLYTIFDIRPRETRIERFDSRIHPSYVYKRA
jgi:hypothetical protein